MASTAPPSKLRTALVVAAVFVAAVVVGILGAPQIVVVLLAAGIGTAVITRDVAARRTSGATAQAGGSLDAYPLKLSAERYGVGPTMQLRFLPPSRAVWAPGLLGVTSGRARFVPAAASRGDRTWEGPVTSAEVRPVGARASVVRFHGAEGSAQFAVTYSASDVREALGQFVTVTR